MISLAHKFMSIISPERISYIKEKWQHAGFQKYSKNTVWMFIGQSSTLISFAINIWLARYLGPTNFGTLSYIIAFVGIFGFLANLGINGILIRDLVKYPGKRDELLGTAFWLLTLGGLTAFILVIISSFILESSSLIRALIIMYSTTFLFSPVTVVASYFQATVQAQKNAWVQIIGVLIIATIKAILILSGKGIIWLAASFVFDYILSASLYAYNYHKSGFKIRLWKFNKVLAIDFLKASWFLMLSAVAGYLLLRIDQVMVKLYLGEASVGIYTVAVRLSEIWYFIPGIICGSLFPAIVNAKITDKKMYFDRLKKLYLFLGGTAFLIAIPMTILAPWIIRILFGMQYMASVPILQIYVWSGIGLFLSTAITQYFTTENYLRTIFYYNLLAITINVILNFILIPTVGLTGAAWATLISYSIGPIIILVSDQFTSIKKYYER
jgi:O-antigen/teichoic acid export membrane protein